MQDFSLQQEAGSRKRGPPGIRGATPRRREKRGPLPAPLPPPAAGAQGGAHPDRARRNIFPPPAILFLLTWMSIFTSVLLSAGFLPVFFVVIFLP